MGGPYGTPVYLCMCVHTVPDAVTGMTWARGGGGLSRLNPSNFVETRARPRGRGSSRTAKTIDPLIGIAGRQTEIEPLFPSPSRARDKALLGVIFGCGRDGSEGGNTRSEVYNALPGEWRGREGNVAIQCRLSKSAPHKGAK